MGLSKGCLPCAGAHTPVDVARPVVREVLVVFGEVFGVEVADHVAGVGVREGAGELGGGDLAGEGEDCCGDGGGEMHFEECV